MKHPGADPRFYEVADLFVDRCLRHDDSLFTPGVAIWTEAHAKELYENFVQRPDTGSESFYEKLERQLAEVSDGGVQLTAEMLFVHFVIAVNVLGSTKRDAIDQVLGWMQDPVTMPDDLGAVLEQGLVRPGSFFNTGRPFLLMWFVEFLRHWKSLTACGVRKLDRLGCGPVGVDLIVGWKVPAA
jgi:5-methylcytosine-specific restriction enzyme B